MVQGSRVELAKIPEGENPLAFTGLRKALLIESAQDWSITKEWMKSVPDARIIDMRSFANGIVPIERIPSATFISGPTMLEMVMMRVEQVGKAMGGSPRVMVHSIEGLLECNSAKSVSAFLNFLRVRLNILGWDLYLGYQHQSSLQSAVPAAILQEATH